MVRPRRKMTPEQRKAVMRAIKGRNTGPELAVRRILWGLGYRYRVHGAGLPGTPDIVFAARRKAVFVNGCFWHQHQPCTLAVIPRSNRHFWIAKLLRNKERDVASKRGLTAMGWKYFVVWECELQRMDKVATRVRRFLGPISHITKKGRT